MEKQKCQKQVMGDWHKYDCPNNAKVERDGKWYCGIHDPVKVAEKDAAKKEKWDRENKLDELRYERQYLTRVILGNKSMDELREMAKSINK